MALQDHQILCSWLHSAVSHLCDPICVVLNFSYVCNPSRSLSPDTRCLPSSRVIIRTRKPAVCQVAVNESLHRSPPLDPVIGKGGQPTIPILQ